MIWDKYSILCLRALYTSRSPFDRDNSLLVFVKCELRNAIADGYNAETADIGYNKPGRVCLKHLPSSTLRGELHDMTSSALTAGVQYWYTAAVKCCRNRLV